MAFTVVDLDQKNEAAILNQSMAEDNDQYITYRIGNALHFYILPCILMLGLIGNLLSFCVMMQAPNRHIPCSVFFAALSVSDNIVMVTTLLFWFHQINDKVSASTCRTYAYFVNVGSSCSCYLIVLITLERFSAICKILKKAYKMSMKATILSVLAVFVMTTIINIPVYFNAVLLETAICASYAIDNVVFTVWVWISTILFFVIPFCLVSYLNIRICLQVRRRWSLIIRGKDQPHQMSKSSSRSFTRSDSKQALDTAVPEGLHQVIIMRTSFNKRQWQQQAERKLTKMMVAISLAFICLSLPQYMRYITYVFINSSSNDSHYTTFCIIFHITNKLFISNNAINFFLYCVTGEKFRKDFVDMLRKSQKQILSLRDRIKQQVSSCGLSKRQCCCP